MVAHAKTSLEGLALDKHRMIMTLILIVSALTLFRCSDDLEGLLFSLMVEYDGCGWG